MLHPVMSDMQGKELYVFCMAITSLLIIFGTAPVHGQIGGVVSSTTGTASSTTSTATDTVNQITSPIANATVSTNITDTSGSVSAGNPLGLPLPDLTIPISASSSVAGVEALGNGTIIASINGVQMKFWFDPHGPKGKHHDRDDRESSDLTITVRSDDLSGSQFGGMFMELQSPSGSDIASGDSPTSFSVHYGTHYIVYANSYQNIVFNHWDDGTTDPSRAVTPTQDMTLTAYYSTGGAATSPQPPTNLAANPISSSQIDLSWKTPQSNGGVAITGYKIERSTGGGAWSTISSNTGTTSTAFSDTGLQSGTTYTYRVSAVNSAGQSAPSNTASATTESLGSIIKVQSGLVASDSLTNVTKTQKELQATHGYWFYDGDAPAENATFSFFRDSGGFHIGIQAPQNGTWAGFYGESPNHNAQLWHAQITNPIRTTKNQFYENGLYVQTANGSINYVTCSTFTNNQATAWAVVNATGDINQITAYEVLYFDTSANQPLTKDCSIVTNGNDFLAVYLDGSKVYEKDNANLQMPAPFNAYLEPQSSDADEFLVGAFKNYYVTTEQNIHVTNLPSNAATVTISDSTGVLASSPVSGGAATINVGQFAFPLAGTIKVYDSAGSLIASSPESIYGGDVYSTKASGGVTTASSAPTTLVATPGNGQVTLSWSAPSSNGGSVITGYNVYRGTTPGGESGTPLATVTTNPYTDSGLTNGQTYYYTVRAVNSAGTSAASNEASATPTSTTTVPSAPLSLSADAASSSQISLSWSAPASNGGSTITGYKVERSTDNGSTWSTIAALSATTYSDTGLSPGITYTYRVSATNSAGTGPPSNMASATTQAAGGSSGIALNNVQLVSGVATLSSSDQVTLSSFNTGTGSNKLLVVGISANNNNVASVTFGGVPLTMAASSFVNNDAEFWYLVNPSGTGDIVVTFSGATHAVVGAYSFSGVDQSSPIPTTSKTHNTSFSNPSISITTTSQNSWVLDLPSIYGGSTLGSPTCTQQWDANIPGFITGASSSMMVPSPTTTTCGWTASPGEQWDDVAVEIKASATGAPATTVPQPPTGLKATGGNAQVSLIWSASSNGGSAITGYKIYRSTSSGTETLLAQTGTVPSYSDATVTNGQAYFYKVAAVNSIGESTRSNEASATPTSTTTVPSAPLSLSADAASSSQISLSWSAPASNGGSTITGYKVERSTDNGSTWSTIAALSATTYSDTGLSPGITYTYRVSATNSAGTGPPSNMASATTQAAGGSSGIALNNVQLVSGVATLSSSDQVTLSSFNTGTGSNKLLVVGISANANDAASVTFGGVPLARIAHSFVNNDAEFWYLVNPSGTGDIVVTMNGPTHAVVGAYSLSGVDQTLPIPAHAVSRDASFSSPTITLATTSQNSWVLDLPSIYGGSTLGSPTCTQQWDANMPGFITGASSSMMVPTPGTVTCSWAASSGEQWDDAAVEIKKN